MSLPTVAAESESQGPPAEIAAERSAPLDARSLLRSAWWMSGGHMAAQATAYVSLLVVARLIHPSNMGAAATGTAILYVAVALMEAGMRGSIVMRATLTRSIVRRTVMRCVIVGLALSVTIALASHWLTETLTPDTRPGVLAALAAGVPLYALASVPLAFLQRDMAFRALARVWAVANVVSGVAAVIAAVAGAGVWALVIRQLCWCGGLAALAWVFARRRLPAQAGAVNRSSAPRGTRWFLVLAVTQVLTLNLDYLIIGKITSARQLGLYTLAFTIAFAPVAHFSEQVGKVLFAAATKSQGASNSGRTIAATRLMTTVLAPTLPVAIVLAPTVLPAVMGHSWVGMVTAFQLLLIAGVGYAVINCIGEALAGGGSVRFRAKVNVAWSLCTLGVLIPLVQADGIRGAAFGQLGIFAAYALVYCTAGARRLDIRPAALLNALGPILLAVAVQATSTAGARVALGDAGMARAPASVAAALLGLTIMLLIGSHGRGSPVREALGALRLVSGQRTS